MCVRYSVGLLTCYYFSVPSVLVVDSSTSALSRAFLSFFFGLVLMVSSCVDKERKKVKDIMKLVADQFQNVTNIFPINYNKTKT